MSGVQCDLHLHFAGTQHLNSECNFKVLSWISVPLCSITFLNHNPSTHIVLLRNYYVISLILAACGAAESGGCGDVPHCRGAAGCNGGFRGGL